MSNLKSTRRLFFVIGWFFNHLIVSQPCEAKIILVDSLCTDKASGYSMQTKKKGLNCWLPNVEENQNHVRFDEKHFFIMWTEEVDLKGKYTSFRNSNLMTRLYVQNINSLKLIDNVDEETKGTIKIDLEKK